MLHTLPLAKLLEFVDSFDLTALARVNKTFNQTIKQYFPNLKNKLYNKAWFTKDYKLIPDKNEAWIAVCSKGVVKMSNINTILSLDYKFKYQTKDSVYVINDSILLRSKDGTIYDCCFNKINGRLIKRPISIKTFKGRKWLDSSWDSIIIDGKNIHHVNIPFSTTINGVIKNWHTKLVYKSSDNDCITQIYTPDKVIEFTGIVTLYYLPTAKYKAIYIKNNLVYLGEDVIAPGYNVVVNDNLMVINNHQGILLVDLDTNQRRLIKITGFTVYGIYGSTIYLVKDMVLIRLKMVI